MIRAGCTYAAKDTPRPVPAPAQRSLVQADRQCHVLALVRVDAD